MSTLFKPLSTTKPCILSVPSFFSSTSKNPHLFLPTLPQTLKLRFSPSCSTSVISSLHKPRDASVVTFVAPTADWAQQEESKEFSNWEAEDEGEDASFQVGESGGDSGEDSLFEERENGQGFVGPPEEAKVFVGNLPFNVDSEKLATLFDRAGTVEIAEVIYNRQTEQSRGFGFVTMSTVEEAEKAVEMFSQYELDGRLLTVNKASPKGSRVENLPRIFDPAFRVYVGNLPWDVDDVQLQQIFSEHGKVVNARVVYDRETGRSRGFGFVVMASETEMNGAIAALNGQSIDGRAIRVDVAEERPRHSSF